MDEQHRHQPPRPPEPPRLPPPVVPPLAQPARIPTPRPTQAERREEAAEAKRRAKAAYAQELKESTVPSWGRDLGRVAGMAGLLVVLGWIAILLVRWRLLTDNSAEVVEDTDVWAAILTMLGPLLFPFLVFKHKRPDDGFRLGTLPFLPVAALAAWAIQVLGMLVWPWLVGADLVPGTVLATIPLHPMSLLTAAGVSLTWTSVFLAVVCGFLTCGARGKWVWSLILILPFLASVLVAAFVNADAFTSPPSIVAATVWMGAGVIALILLTGTDLLRNLLLRKQEATSTVAYRPTLDELGWNPQ